MIERTICRYQSCKSLATTVAADANKAVRGAYVLERLEERASDGFNLMFPWLPGGLEDFTSLVVPELQRRGIFRTEYEGSTLREHLGLPRPENRFFATQ